VSDDKQSIWKKEISFRRTKDDAPTEERVLDELEQIKAAAEQVVQPEPVVPEPEPEPAPEPVPVVSSFAAPVAPVAPLPLPVPVAPAPAPAPEPEPELEPAAESVPFWKKELSFSRKEKAEKPKKQKRVKAPKEPKAKREPKPKQEKQSDGDAVPFWKREISIGKRKAPRERAASGKRLLRMPRLERPARAKRGGHVPKKLVGLKIGASQIAAARVANNGSAELLQVARADLEPGIVVGGELREPEKLAEILRDFFREHHLPKRGVRLGIANNRIGVRTFDIAGITDGKQLDNAIKFRAQEALPIPIEDAVLDYQVLSESTDEEGQQVKRVLLVVAYRDLVDRYVTACRKAGVELVGIDLEAFALLRAMAAPRELEAMPDAAVVVVSVGHDRSTFAVSDGRVCEFTRVLEWGGTALNVALARVLDLAPSEAEPFKRQLNLNTPVPPPGLTAEQYEACREAVRKQIQSFARELVSSLQFYQNQPGSLGIAEIVLTGGTAHLPGLSEELQRLIGVTVRVGDPLMRVRVGKKAVSDEEQLGSLAIAIGLGIED
jgi:type IV pilus assembly protein PilM